MILIYQDCGVGEHQVNGGSLSRGGFSFTRHAEDLATLSMLKDKSKSLIS